MGKTSEWKGRGVEKPDRMIEWTHSTEFSEVIQFCSKIPELGYDSFNFMSRADQALLSGVWAYRQ
jgi:hypothetical protein